MTVYSKCGIPPLAGALQWWSRTSLIKSLLLFTSHLFTLPILAQLLVCRGGRPASSCPSKKLHSQPHCHGDQWHIYFHTFLYILVVFSGLVYLKMFVLCTFKIKSFIVCETISTHTDLQRNHIKLQELVRFIVGSLLRHPQYGTVLLWFTVELTVNLTAVALHFSKFPLWSPFPNVCIFIPKDHSLHVICFWLK